MKNFPRSAHLALAASLLLGGCDHEGEEVKNKVESLLRENPNKITYVDASKTYYGDERFSGIPRDNIDGLVDSRTRMLQVSESINKKELTLDEVFDVILSSEEAVITNEDTELSFGEYSINKRGGEYAITTGNVGGTFIEYLIPKGIKLDASVFGGELILNLTGDIAVRGYSAESIFRTKSVGKIGVLKITAGLYAKKK